MTFYLNDKELRDKILALKRPLPHEATYLIEAELDDLVQLVNQAVVQARIEELGAVVSGLQEGYVPSIIAIQQMKDRLADLTKQNEAA